ncbi:ycaO protein [Sphingomonas sp. KC8]|nr:ycaO protein [Sphingomonas sp. KC8]
MTQAGRRTHAGHRALSPSVMLARLRPVAQAAGITRLADLTGLDRIGLPVFQAVRPMARSLAVALGKGHDPGMARLSALVESIELHRAENLVATGPYRAADRCEAVAWSQIRPAAGQAGRFDPLRKRHWIAAYDMIGGGRIGVPFDLVNMDFGRPIAPDLWQSSNGLASGSDRDEAIISGLLELLEREALERWYALPRTARRATRINLASIDDRRLRAMLARITRAGLRLIIWDMAEAIGVPAFQCVLIEMQSAATLILPPGIGTACDPDAAIALMAAIGEAAQARIMFIAGARDDLSVDDYRDPAGRRLGVVRETLAFEPDGVRQWQGTPAMAAGDRRGLIDWLVSRCAAAGAATLACVELDDGMDGLATVKMLVPGFADHVRPSAFA